MRKQKRNLLITLCSAVAALGFVAGAWASLPNVSVDASGEAPIVTMVSGASTRKTSPGIKFTAKIDNYDKAYQYGMLILPETAWENCGWNDETDYFQYFADNSIAESQYANKICGVYIDKETGEYKISYSLTEINTYNYDMSFVGVAYTLKDGVYNYADIDLVENGRSIAYVAQMALKYEDGLSQEERLSLENFANPSNIKIEKEDYWTNPGESTGGDTIATVDNYALKRTFNVDESISLITKQAYAGGSTVSFKYYIPADTSTQGWWGIAWNTDASMANIYHAAGVEDNYVGHQALGKDLGVWTDVAFTLPSGGPYYLYFGSSVSSAESPCWLLNGKNSYALIDNFTINGETETFNENINDNIFNVNASAISAELIEKGEVAFEGAANNGEYSAKIIVDKIKSDKGLATFVTKESYPAGSVVTFKYYIPTDVKVGGWAKLCCVAKPTETSIYDNWILDLPIKTGEWIEKTVTLASAGYLHFAADVGQWGAGEGYILIDDFSIDGTTETFNKGVQKSIFNINIEGAVIDGDGYASTENTPEELGEVAMKILFNHGDDGVRARTTKAYAGGSTVSFRYYIQADAGVQWTRFIWDTDTSCDNYADTYTSFGNTAGEWVTWSYTLPSGGPYYLYFGFECGNWKDSSGTPYILIDDFTVNGEVESFNYGVENSIFTVLQTNLAGNSEIGEGWTPLNGKFGAKLQIDLISSTKTTPSFITSGKYVSDGTLTVSFDYYMSGNTKNKWWTLAWTTSNTNASIYAGVSSSNTTSENSAQSLPTNVQDAWATTTVTIPAGEWYFYFAGAVNEWSGGYVIIDNFKIGDIVTETFNNGEYGIFLDNRDSKPDAITIAEGKEDFVPGEYAAKLDFTNSFDNNASTFITKQAYAGGSTVSFKYYIPEETTIGDWWSICWDTNGSSPNFWAVGNGIATPNGGVNPNPNKLKTGKWVEYSITLPAGGPYYLYFCGYQNWNGCVYIDNFTVGNVTETFNNGWGESIFNANPAYVGLGEGTAPEEPEVTNTDPYALENLLKDTDKLSDVLENGGYAWLESMGSIDAKNIPAGRLLVEGVIDFTIKGEKEFAIYFGNNVFIFVSTNVVEAYNGTTKVGAIEYALAEGAKSVKLYFTITSDGKLNVSVNQNGYVGFGTVMPNQMKIVGLGGKGGAIFNTISVETYKCVYYLEDAPVYVSDEVIDFTAYMFDTDNMVTEAGFQLLADAGFTKTLGLLQGRSPSDDLHEQVIRGNKNCTCASAEEHVAKLMAEVNADAMAALELAEKFGLKHYVSNSNIMNIERDPNNYEWFDEFADQATYTMSEAFAGHFLADEPQSGKWFTDDELGELVNAYKAYKAAFPNSEAYINLLPRNSSQFTGDSLYENYIDEYIEKIALDYNGVPGTGYVSFDHYPLHDDGVTATHLRNLELVAQKCRDNNIELRTYIKASRSGDTEREIRATETINDLYMQIYSALAYGSKEIVYYQFTEGSTAADSVISGTTLEKGNVYNWTKQANNEVRAFEKAYMNFTWKSASVFGKTNLTQFNNLKSKASAYGYISSVSSSASVLVGNFARNEGVKAQSGDNYAYMVVNYGNTDGATAATTAVNITFNGTPTKALVYQAGMASVVTLSANVLTLNLQLGEGAFVIPLV